MTAPARIPQADLLRIFKAAKEADYPVAVRLCADGDVVITPASAKDEDGANPWDEDNDEA